MNASTLPRQRRKPTCIIYVRLSRADDLSTSIKSQVDACRAYALSQGWHVLFVADQDNGVSGASKLEDRPGMSRVLAALPQADYLLAVKVDRFARSLMEFTTLVTLTAEHGTTLVTADGTLSAATSGFMAKLFGSEAIARLNKGAAKRGHAGKWPCAVGLCKREEEPESVLHDPSDMELWHTSRARLMKITMPEIKGTDRSPVCKPCSGRAARKAMMWGDRFGD